MVAPVVETKPHWAHPSPRSWEWMLGARADLMLLIATPLLVLPVLHAIHLGVSWEQLALIVAAFGATGHHLPGMLRAYGDRGLFHQYRARFIVAPIFLVVVCVYSSLHDLGGVFMVVAVWGIWHAAMQTYGMARIYDAKVAPYSALTSRLDWLLCLAWFGAGMLSSPVRMGKILSPFYEAGGFWVASEIFGWVQLGWFAGAVVITAFYVFHLVSEYRQGRPVSWIKLLLLVISCGFWWYTTASVRHMLVGIALWEICHDVQYLTIVWIFNRGRVEGDAQVGAFTRFVFRRSPALVGVYIGLVVGYGALAWFGVRDFGAPTNQILEGLLVASGLLHFYFDGFIWKVRDRSVGATLALRQDAAQATWRNATSLRHLAAWSAFVVPIVLLGVVQSSGVPSEIERLDALLVTVPGYSDGYNQRGLALTRTRRLEEAAHDFDTAIAQQPDHAKAQVNRLLLRAMQRDRPADKLPVYREALAIHPDDPRTHQLLANALRVTGDDEAAFDHYRKALQAAPDHPSAHFGLATLLARTGAVSEAILHYEAGLQIRPRDARARTAFAALLLEQGQVKSAESQLEAALLDAPEDRRARSALERLRARPVRR